LLVGSVAITALCAQYTTLLMATSVSTSSTGPTVASERANWSDEEVTALVNYLYPTVQLQGTVGATSSRQYSTQLQQRLHLS
jgi:hypothetical protein